MKLWTKAPKFLGVVQPVVQVLADDWFRLRRPWAYEWAWEGDVYRIFIRSGFEFDGASIPPIAHPFFGGRWSLGLGPPLAHDALYRCEGDFTKAVFGIHPDETPESIALAGKRYGWYERLGDDSWEEVDWVWSRKDADRLFGRHMREAGVRRWRRRTAYRTVRLFGRGSWGRG